MPFHQFEEYAEASSTDETCHELRMPQLFFHDRIQRMPAVRVDYLSIMISGVVGALLLARSWYLVFRIIVS